MKRFIVFGCLICIVLSVAIVIHLSQIKTTEISFIIVPQSIEELTVASDIIITGEVISSQPLLLTQRLSSSMPEYEEFIVTRYAIRVDEYLKGSGPSTVRVNLLGGQVGKRIFIAPDEASMEVGERVLLFLASSEEDHDYYSGPNSKNHNGCDNAHPLLRVPGMGNVYRGRVPNVEGDSSCSSRQGCPPRGGI